MNNWDVWWDVPVRRLWRLKGPLVVGFVDNHLLHGGLPSLCWVAIASRDFISYVVLPQSTVN